MRRERRERIRIKETDQPRLLLRDFEDTLPQFDGEDQLYAVENWIRDMQKIATEYRWSVSKIVISVRKSLRGTQGSGEFWKDK